MGSRVELYAAIRFDWQRNQMSIRALADKYGVHRRTVREAIDSPIPRWTSWRSWSTGWRSASTAAWSPSASASTGPSTRLALVEGSTENASLVTELIVGLRERGWTSPAPSWW
jgi:hypothetical protein